MFRRESVRAYLLFQNIIQRIWEKEFIGRCAVIKGNIVTAAAEFVVAFSALPVGIQLVPPSDHLFKIPLCSGGILQTGKGFCPQLPFELLSFRFLISGIVLKGMFFSIGFQPVYDILLQSDLPLCLSSGRENGRKPYGKQSTNRHHRKMNKKQHNDI